jgi:general secretion pathway protein J
MMRRRAHRHAGTAGFTLVEALAATALMGVVLTALAALAGQWLPNWNRGIVRAQSSEIVGVALERLVGDVAASQYVTPGRDAKNPLFDGTPSAVVFVRTAFGPNARPGLEVVRIAQIRDGNDVALVRSTAPFTPVGANVSAPILPNFVDPVVLLPSPYLVSFAYAGRDGAWKDFWRNAQELPAVVRITVRRADSERALSVSTAALIHVDLPAACVKQKGPGQQGQGLSPGQVQAQAQAQAQALQIQAQAQAQALQAQGRATSPQGLQAQPQGPSCDGGAPEPQQDQAAAATRPPGG